MNAPTIYRLIIEGFRGVKTLEWHPSAGMNVILGGGDVGKTTVLDAIGLLLSPTNPATLSDADYHQRDLTAGFIIEAVMWLPEETLVNQQSKPSWPWEWNGKEPAVPALGEGGEPGKPVYVLRVSGSPDLELLHEIVQPSGDTDHLSVSLRRAIGLVRLSGDDRNDRDLRLVQGSALDRLLSDKALRSRLGSKLAKSDVKEALEDKAKKTLTDLDNSFKQKTLPHNLDLSITGAQGITITALIGLTADREGVQLPLASWGAGTRRLAALAIAEQDQNASPITLVDEVERGLEPYRQRTLIQKLQAAQSQVFATTHSAPVISAATNASLWYIDHGVRIGPLAGKPVVSHQKNSPETFLARLAVVAEGVTEIGFVLALLEKALGLPPDQYGVHVSDGEGHEATLGLLETLSASGLRFGCFADDEGKHPERWKRLQEKLGPLLFKWQAGCLEENIIRAVPADKLEALIRDPNDELTGVRLRTLADRLGITEKDFNTVRQSAGNGFQSLIIGAAAGSVPPGKHAEAKIFKKHGQNWFKTVHGGRELAGKFFAFGLWPEFKDRFLPFLNGIRRAVGLAELPDVPL